MDKEMIRRGFCSEELALQWGEEQRVNNPESYYIAEGYNEDGDYIIAYFEAE